MPLMKSVSNLPGKLATHPWLMLLCVMLLIELAAEMVFRGACNGLLMAWSISPLALLCNTWLLAAGSVLLYVATNRLALTLLLVCSSYLCMVVGNLLKTGYMHATVQPMDFVYLPEFFQISGSFLGVFGIAALIVGLLALLGGSILLWNRGRCAACRHSRQSGRDRCTGHARWRGDGCGRRVPWRHPWAWYEYVGFDPCRKRSWLAPGAFLGVSVSSRNPAGALHPG